MATYTKTVDPNGGADYPNIATWEAGEQTLYSSGDIAFADLYRTGASKDTTAVTVAGWTAGVIPKIIVNPAHRHEGKWADRQGPTGTGNYIYHLEISVSAHGLSLSASTGFACTVDGLCISYTSGAPSSSNSALRVSNPGSDATFLTNNIIRNLSTGSQRGILYDGFADRNVLYNNIVIGFSANTGIYNNNGDTWLYNNTVYGCSTGITTVGGTPIIKNNYCGGNTTDYSIGAGTSDYNVSSDATAPGTNKATGKTSYADYFVDHAAGDFRLKNSSQNLWGIASANLTSTFTTDILGTTRPDSDQFGIGAHLYVAAGGGPTTYPCSVVGIFPSPGGSLATASRFGQAVFGDAPAPTGSINKKTSRLLFGDAPAPAGSISKKTSRLLLGDAPAASGTLSEGYRTTQSTSGIMGTITGALAAVFDAGGGVISRIWQRIKIGIGIGI